MIDVGDPDWFIYPFRMDQATVTAMPLERDVLIVQGSDARSYLQTQLTQDVEAIGLGRSVWSFILDPKGSIEALVRVTRIGHDRLTLDVEHNLGEAVRSRLDGPLFRMDVRFSQAVWPGVVWCGDPSLYRVPDAPIVSGWTRAGLTGTVVVGPQVVVPDVPAGDLEELRVRVGWPAMGAELGDRITPAMTGLLDLTVSFTKGCYTGQEPVARSHNHGAKPTKRLVRVSTDADVVSAGGEFAINGEPAGQITSMLTSGEGLGYLARKFETPAEATVGGTQVRLSEVEAAVAV